MKFIAIRSLTYDPPFSDDVQPPVSRHDAETAGGRMVDEDSETGLRYMNPSLVLPLEDAWLPRKHHRRHNGEHGSHHRGHEDGNANANGTQQGDATQNV